MGISSANATETLPKATETVVPETVVPETVVPETNDTTAPVEDDDLPF